MGQKTVTISNDQSVFDIAVQELGNSGAAYELAWVNGIAVTDDLIPGQILIIPESTSVKQEIVSALAKDRKKISTGIEPGDMITEPDGIEFMGIETTFTVG